MDTIWTPELTEIQGIDLQNGQVISFYQSKEKLVSLFLLFQIELLED